jgi:hypothetical protein
MQKLALATALAAAIFIPGSLYSGSAVADGGYHHHHHHHHSHHHVRWGNNDFDIVRWSNGDCKIWHDDDGAPAGTDWVVLAEDLPTYDAAWRALVHLQGHHKCT